MTTALSVYHTFSGGYLCVWAVSVVTAYRPKRQFRFNLIFSMNKVLKDNAPACGIPATSVKKHGISYVGVITILPSIDACTNMLHISGHVYQLYIFY